MKRTVCFLLAMCLCLSLFSCGKSKSGGQEGEEMITVKEGVPVYADDISIELGAYCSPPIARNGQRSYITAEDFKDYKDAGFTFVMSEADAEYDGTSSFTRSDLYRFMEAAKQAGIPVLVGNSKLIGMTSSSDPRLTEETKNYLTRVVADLSSYGEIFKGFTFRDEPSIDYMPSVKAVREYLLGLKPDSFFCTSTLPLYAPDVSVYSKTEKDRLKAYEEYVAAAMDATGAFYYDDYPLIKDPIRNLSVLEETWLKNLEIVQSVAKKKGTTNLGITVQSCGFAPSMDPDVEQTTVHHRRIQSKADIGFQVYSALAYGMKTIGYFTYWQHVSNGVETFLDGMVVYPEKKGDPAVKTPAYYAVQQINNEIKKFDHVFLQYDWQGTMKVLANGKAQNSLMSGVRDYVSPRISEASSTGDAIIGCMKDKEGYDGFWLVNMTDPATPQNNTVTVTFRKASKAICYVEGEEKTVDLKDGSYSFELKSGSGVFVIPIV